MPSSLRPNVVLAIAPLLLLGLLGASPAKVWKMEPEALQAVSDRDLCDALALARDRRKPDAEVEAEARRRKQSCAEVIERVVSDCSILKVTDIQGDPSQGATIFTIVNRSPKTKTFRIYYRHFQSSRFTIGPKATGQFGVAVDSRVGGLGSGVARMQGDTEVQLNECVTAWR